MARLIASAALAGLPMTVGGVTLTAVERGPETLVAALKGRETASALRQLGLGFPRPNRFESAEGVAILWAGPGRALLVGAEPPEGLADGATLTDQTGAQAVVLLTGTGIEDVLARLVPVDLRAAAFPVGSLALTLLGHMTASLRRTEEGIEVAVMRSMGQTMVDEIVEAARHVAARAALG